MTLIYPDPEEHAIRCDEIEELLLKAQDKLTQIIRLTFHRPELYDAWYAKEVECKSLRQIAQAQCITLRQAKRRLQVARSVILKMRKTLHKVDD